MGRRAVVAAGGVAALMCCPLGSLVLCAAGASLDGLGPGGAAGYLPVGQPGSGLVLGTLFPGTPVAKVGRVPYGATPQIWAFWAAFKALEPSAINDGIYANKRGYHNTRNANRAKWPGNYSIRDPQDRRGPPDKAAAIDLTFPDAKRGDYRTIMKYSARLLASGLDRADERGRFLREFYGNADGGSTVEGWDFRYARFVRSDSSHLWHIHISFSREHVTNPMAARALLSIMAGEPVTRWRAAEAALARSSRT